jgi:hypothetical protein
MLQKRVNQPLALNRRKTPSRADCKVIPYIEVLVLYLERPPDNSVQLHSLKGRF